MKITVVPYAGLCNRMHAIVSALAYKQMHPEVELKIYWHKWFNCNCRFSDLFEQLPEGMVPVQELKYNFKIIPGHKLNFGIPQKLRHLWFDCSILSDSNADYFDEIVRGCQNIYVYKDNRFCKYSIDSSLATIFHPQKDIQDRIDSITANWENNVIGLHIRRTDNALSINKSPIEHFYNVIDSEMKTNANCRFYLASDDEGVKADLISRYGTKIITTQLCLKRSSLQGMKDAVVDLFCLGLTSKIYGSAASSYSQLASKLYNRNLII